MSPQKAPVEVPDSLYDLPYAGQGISGIVKILDEHHVIKSPHQRSLEEAAVERKIYQRLGDHPRITKVIEYHKRGIIMERLHGPLRKRLIDLKAADKRTTTEEILRWSMQATEGFQYIHSKGVFQVDISAGNIVFDDEDNLKLVDFAGSSMDGSQPIALAGEREQHPDFLHPVLPTVISELFALGTIMYEIEHGEKYLPDADPRYCEIEEGYKAGKFPNTEGFLVDSVIQKCWRSEYHDAGEVLADLERIRREHFDSINSGDPSKGIASATNEHTDIAAHKMPW